jgi:hypothetical protein
MSSRTQYNCTATISRALADPLPHENSVLDNKGVPAAARALVFRKFLLDVFIDLLLKDKKLFFQIKLKI